MSVGAKAKDIHPRDVLEDEGDDDRGLAVRPTRARTLTREPRLPAL